MNRSAPLSADEIRDVVADYQAGKPIRAIATRHRRPYGTVRNALLRAGVELRDRGYRSRRATTTQGATNA